MKNKTVEIDLELLEIILDYSSEGIEEDYLLRKAVTRIYKEIEKQESKNDQ